MLTYPGLTNRDDDRRSDGPVLPAPLADVLRRAQAASARSGQPSEEAITAIRASGLLGTAVPAEYGGAGGDALACNAIVEKVARINPSLAIILFQHFAVTARIREWGTAGQREHYLPAMASGACLAASAWSETGGGAAKKDIRSTGTSLPDGSWRLEGEKSFTTSAGLADLYLVLVRTSPPGPEQPGAGMARAYGAAGQTFFLVPAGTPGLVPDLSFDLAGMRGSSTGFVGMTGAVVRGEDQLGPLGDAPAIIAGVRETGATLGAVALGIAQAAYDIGLDWVRGSAPSRQQALRDQLVDLETMVEAAGALVERAGRRTSPAPGLTTLRSKLYASQVAERVSLDIAGLLGSGGYVTNHRVNQLIADARAVALMGPTNELCRELIAASWTEAAS
jgi:alkylation response protein AidB-like acyl-CoA dehydrogenase